MTQNNSKFSLAIFTLASCMFLPSIGTSIANIALPNLSQSFSANHSDIYWVITVYLGANTLFIVAAGRVGDIFGRAKVLGIGILFFSMASFLCAVSDRLWIFLVGRALQGIGAAVLMALTVALVSDLVPQNRIGRMMGLLATASAIGTASGPSIGGLLLSVFNWQFIFFALGTLSIFIFVLSYLFIPWTSGRVIQYRESVFSKSAFSLVRIPILSGLLMNLCVSTVMMCTLVVGPFYLSNTLHLGTILVGTVMTVGPLASIISGVVAGRAVDRIGPTKVIIMGLIFVVIGCLSFTILPSRFGVAGYVISAALLSPGYQMFQAGNNSMMMMEVSDNQKGFVSGILSFSRNSGLIIGSTGMGLIFSNYGIERTFFVASLIALTALILASGKANLQERTI